MKDTEKVKTTVANIKAAHAKGCSTVKEALETLYPEVFKSKFKVGDKFKHKGTDIYILASLCPSYALVSVDSGYVYGTVFNDLSDPNEVFTGCPDFFTKL